MHSYAIFTTRKGRPRSQPDIDQSILLKAQTKSADADVLLSLFYLKKITNEQNESAKFYQVLHREYHKSIDSPTVSSSSMIMVENSACRSVRHPRMQDQNIFKTWISLKEELVQIDSHCEELMHKVVIENKMKYELLNPTNLTRNNLRILQQGLDRITSYRIKHNMMH